MRTRNAAWLIYLVIEHYTLCIYKGLLTTRIAKLVRWLQLQVTTLSFISARVTQPSVVHSVYVKYEIKSHRLEIFVI